MLCIVHQISVWYKMIEDMILCRGTRGLYSAGHKVKEVLIKIGKVFGLIKGGIAGIRRFDIQGSAVRMYFQRTIVNQALLLYDG